MDFLARIGTAEGRVLERTFVAPDEATLRSDLEKQGHHVFAVKPKGFAGLALPRLADRRRVLTPQEFLIFNQELAALLRAGLPLLQGLDLMLERLEKPRFREVLTDIRDRVRSGEDLSDAFAAHGDHFPRLYPASLKAGERSGELEAVLRRFIRYQQLVLDAKKRAVSALIYPAVLVALSFGMLLILSIRVVPTFNEFYTSLDAELPLLTRVTVGFSTFLSRNLLWITIAIVVGSFFFSRWKRTPSGRLAFDKLKLRLPLFGPVAHLFALSELCRSLATLLSGGLPLVPSFEIATQAVGNAAVRHAIEPKIRLVREGKAFYEAIEESGMFPAMAIDMTKVGEATGALDEMLGSVATFFDERVEVRLQRILSLVEPAMLVFMGVVVAIILLSLYLPLFSA
ncbi:MAG TPA: type II secretion system F family protein, partial [Thermoanaerobaculia bacterium]|nr:type II secretion system F family protein [Thermoanaerobaculia bacterium]